MTFENSYWQFLKSLAKFLKLLASYISHVAYRQLASDISTIAPQRGDEDRLRSPANHL